MCAVTVMCVTLMVLGVGSGHPPPHQNCLSECVMRCREMVGEAKLPTCCQCRSLCATACQSQLISGTPSEPPSSPCVAGACGLPEEVWTQLVLSCASCRALKEAAIIARSVGMDLGDPSEADTNYSSADDGRRNKPSQMWGLRLESLTASNATTSVSVRWDSSLAMGACYLVSWEAEQSPLRGSLLTNSSSTSLTLLPDVIYHIQVTSVATGDTTECLTVNTRPQPVHKLRLHGVDRPVTFLVLVVILCAGLWLCRTTAVSKDAEQLPNSGYFKRYPPPVTLVLPPPASLQTV